MPNPILTDGAALLDITITPGLTFQFTAVYKDKAGAPINITGYTFDGNITDGLGGPVLATFDIAIIDAVNGKFSVSLTDIVTATLTIGNHFYFINLTDLSSTIIWLLKGTAEVRPGQ